MYNHGNGLKQDFGEAVRFFRKAADQGDAEAQCVLGILYEKGQGVKQDFGEAVRCFRKAADQGNAAGLNYLGGAYRKGEGVAQGDVEAARWLRMAADQGHEPAKDALLLVEDMLLEQRQAPITTAFHFENLSQRRRHRESGRRRRP